MEKHGTCKRKQRGVRGGLKRIDSARFVCFLFTGGAVCSDITGFPLHFQQPGHRTARVTLPAANQFNDFIRDTPPPPPPPPPPPLVPSENACGICDERFPRSYFRKSKSHVWWKESPATRFESWLKRERIDCSLFFLLSFFPSSFFFFFIFSFYYKGTACFFFCIRVTSCN